MICIIFTYNIVFHIPDFFLIDFFLIRHSQTQNAAPWVAHTTICSALAVLHKLHTVFNLGYEKCRISCLSGVKDMMSQALTKAAVFARMQKMRKV